MPPLAFTLRPFGALSLQELHDLVRLREEVFVVGQRITAEAEFDGLDPQAHHVLARAAGGGLVATARLFLGSDPVKVGRVAVAVPLQRGGVGTALMGYVHEVLGHRPAVMSAQAHLVGWYRRLGWVPEGDGYDECGIPHQRLGRRG
ncbi:MAG: GNAT family N-acetyltransferase [Planctomycetia bacterium]